MNEHKSAMSCGYDPGALHQCAACTATGTAYGSSLMMQPFTPGAIHYATTPPTAQSPSENTGSRLFTTDAATRKGFPIFTGCLMYFPDALAALAAVSKMGNDQHNPGEPLHWAREKSTDQMDTATRHMMDHGTGYTKDTDGAYHLAKAAWRILAELQLTIERERA